MKHHLHLSVLFVFIISLFFFSRAEAQSPLSTGFTYQGSLAIDGTPVDGTCDFQFSLWDALSSGAQVGSTVPKDAVLVTDGVFTVKLDFGAVFTGDARWLQVAARCPAGSGSYTTLSPRQELSAAPYSLYSLNADKLDGQDASAFALVGHTHPASGWNLTGNTGTTPGTNYIGTNDNQALEIKVNGQRVMRMEPNATSPNIIGGYSGNWITASVFGATIAGGGESGYPNKVTDTYGVIGGGNGNQAGDNAGTTMDKPYATVGGGASNTASGYDSTVSGGVQNTASGQQSTVGGGIGNLASGNFTVIPGGSNNTASALYAFAAGRRAIAKNQGSFVWADSTDADFFSNLTNTFNVRAYGGVRFVTNGASATIDGNTIWNAGNDGAGSSLDADLLDGLHANQIVAATSWTITGNTGTTPGTNYIGTNDNQALEIKVNGQRVMRLEPDATSPNIINGYNGNWITSGVYGATISGGGLSGQLNRVTDNYGTVSGGRNNQAGDNGGTVSDRDLATVSGGILNVASGSLSAIGGGSSNLAPGTATTISGGALNYASAPYSTVPGGNENSARGDYSFAAGRHATAWYAGDFVWADSTGTDFASTAANQFSVRANGGVRFVTNGAGATIDDNTIWYAGNDGTGSTLDADLLDGQHSAAFWNLSGNSGSTPGTNYIGTSDNQALEIKVNNTRVLRLEPNSSSPNIIGGSSGNWITSGVYGAFIGGGGGIPKNRVTDNFSVVAGGNNNQAGDNAGSTYDHEFATVSGGYTNFAFGYGSTVSGGDSNSADGYESTVGGGSDNAATGETSTVSGGNWNWASGLSSTVCGGDSNTAAGVYSFAAGHRAKANSTGTFVWADSTDADFIDNVENLFAVRATGGVYLYTNSALTSGSYLAAGSGTWASVSDRAVKANFTEVQPIEVLEKVAAMPISTWNYISEDPAIRHMGPMAQDFHAAFGLGDSEKSIGTIDADGVALASIQALYAKTQELQAEIDALKAGQPVAAGYSAFGLSLPWLLLGGLGLLNAGFLLGRRFQAPPFPPQMSRIWRGSRGLHPRRGLSKTRRGK